MSRSEELFERIIAEGQAAIDEFIVSRASEELFLDFKRSSDNGDSQRLSQNDRNNLAKAVSGFGNSSGGVLVWGVDCSRDNDGADVARAKFPIVNVQRFSANIQGAISGCTIPPHDRVQNHAIVSADGESGFLVTYIPESMNSPHQVVGRQQYYIRAGSDFVPAPHQVLAGMFGKRPQPHIHHMYSLHPIKNEIESLILEIGIVIANGGRGIARDIFFNATAIDLIGENCTISWQPLDQNWTGNLGFGRIINIIANEGVRLPPKAFHIPILLRIELKPPFSEDLRIDASIGCTDSPLWNFSIKNTNSNIETEYERFFQLLQDGQLTEELKADITSSILSIDAGGEVYT